MGGRPDRELFRGDERPVRGARLLPVGGGKGGVGKTFVAANLAALLARAGGRVVAMDGDLEGANLHTALGVRRPHASLAEYVAEREDDLGKLLEDTPVAGLRLLAATGSDLGTPQPSHARRVQLIRDLRRLDADFVVIDLGAGTDAAVMDYFMVCDDGIVVIAPEPTSIENAYAFMRSAFYRRLQLAMISHDVRAIVRAAMDEHNDRGIRTPHDLLREVERIDPQEGARFAATMRGFHPRIIVNDARTAEDIRLGFAVRSVCRKYFAIDAEYLGYVNHDVAARSSVRDCRPLVEGSPKASASVYLSRIASKLLTTEPSEAREEPV
jgi:flagellar biosynthesis protein FlhG